MVIGGNKMIAAMLLGSFVGLVGAYFLAVYTKDL